MRKHVKARLERNRALGQQDAANRCDFCRKPFVGSFKVYLHGQWFCSFSCGDDWFDAKLTMAGARLGRR